MIFALTCDVLLMALAGWGALGSVTALVTTSFAVGIDGPSRDLTIKRTTPKESTGLDLGFVLAPLLFGALMDKD